jgi:hypothetical protein
MMPFVQPRVCTKARDRERLGDFGDGDPVKLMHDEHGAPWQRHSLERGV